MNLKVVVDPSEISNKLFTATIFTSFVSHIIERNTLSLVLKFILVNAITYLLF